MAVLLSAAAAAQFPALNSIQPRGAQRGTEVEVTLKGNKLGDARALLFDPGGIEVRKLKQKKDGKLVAQLAIAPDAPLGLRAVWVQTATGLSDLATFSVGALPELEEAEPNGSAEEAQAIPLDCTVNGVAEDEDVDYYAFEGRAGERVSVEIEGMRLGDELFDPAVALLDAAGFALASCDDSALARQDPALSARLPRNGRYYVRVRESAYRGNKNYYYRVHVGRFPRPLTTLPLGGRPGESLAPLWLGADHVQEGTPVTLPAEGETLSLIHI